MFLEIKGKPLVPLELGQLYLLGKQLNGDINKNKNFIVLEEEEDVCERHCVIEINQNKEALVFDLLSLKGTLLNNKILNRLEKTLLNNGDILKLGRNEIKYFLDEEKMLQSRDSLSVTNRRSDSFAIPETQYCQSRNSMNGSNLSIAESNPDNNEGNVKFNFGNLNSFEEDDDLCIPETQLPADNIPNQRSHSISNVQNSTNESSILQKKSSRPECDESQFRICTQDYNEGFGEEESVSRLQSQIIPFINHQTVLLNNTAKMLNSQSMNQSNKGPEDKELSSLKWSNSIIDQETTELRATCLTPDIFDFEVLEAVSKKQESTKANRSTCIANIEQEHNLQDEDEQDLLPTQVFVPDSVITKVVEERSLNEPDKPCFEIENEEIITLSDKENRCPARLEPIAKLPPTQLFEAVAAKSNKSSTSAIKSSTNANVENSFNCLLNVDHDEEDDLLTQAFLQPASSSIKATSAISKNLPDKCFNSTLLDDKVLPKNPVSFFAEIEKTPLKQTSSATVFKMPEKENSVVRKTSSVVSVTSENDLDLLMCTPQFIKDNMFMGKSEDLRRNILAAKNRHLFADETEEEEEEDDQGDLVKLINIPKESLDFDMLLPHLNRKAESIKINEEQNSSKEAQKIYKFNISFGKEDQKQLKSSVSKSSSLSRDDRHEARNKEKEIAERKRQLKSKEEKSKGEPKYKEISKRKENKLDRKDKEKELKEKEMERMKKQIERENKRKMDEQKKVELKQDKKAKKKELESKKDTEKNSGQRNIEKKSNTKTSTTLENPGEINTRLRKRLPSSDKIEKEVKLESEVQQMPARRMTRLRSKLEENPLIEDYTATDPIVKSRSTRSRSKQNDSQESVASKNSMQKSKTERKRKAEVPTTAPAKIDRKRLRNESPTSSTKTISISMTMVDQELIKNLYENCNGLWNISTNCADCNILVMDKPYRTFKFLLAVARGIPIVTSEYLKKINENKSAKGVKMANYNFTNAEFEKKYKFSLVESLQAAKKHKILKGYEFLTTANILPNPQEIKSIIEASGGHVHEKTPPQPEENQKLYLVSTKHDKKDWHKYRRLNKNIIIISTEAIMSAVMSQNCDRMRSFILS